MRILNILGAIKGEALIIVNGEVQEQNQIRNSAINQLLSLEKAVSSKPFIWKGQVNRFHYIQGQLSNKDDNGKKMSFSFCSNESADSRSLLIEDLRANGFQMDEETERCINKKAFPFVYIAFTVFLLIIIVVICSIVLK